MLPDSAMKMMVLPMYGGLPASEQVTQLEFISCIGLLEFCCS